MNHIKISKYKQDAKWEPKRTQATYNNRNKKHRDILRIRRAIDNQINETRHTYNHNNKEQYNKTRKTYKSQ